MPSPATAVILLSGRGSNMVAIAAAARAGSIPVRIAAVLSDKPEAAGLQRARELGLPAEAVPAAGASSREAYDAVLAARVRAHAPDVVVLAGFMRILSAAFVQEFQGRMLNVHPSLLPRYPGLHTHRRALAAGDKLHGCTVHFVTEELDGGPAVLQAKVPILPGDDEASLSARVQRQEHILYPEAVGLLAAGRLALRDGRAWLDGRLLEAPVIRGEA
jgi:phosphoribosylglycinamide formyltransferase-1